MTYYDDSYRRKQTEGERERHKTPTTPRWHVASAKVVPDGEHDVFVLLDKEVSKEKLLKTLQFLCDEAFMVEGEGLPTLLSLTSEEHMQVSEDGSIRLKMAKREYAILTAALLPSYLEPSRKNLTREQGFRSVAMHPVLLRYVLRKTGDSAIDKWRTWAAVRTLAGYVNATVPKFPSVNYCGGLFPISSGWFPLYELLPRVLHAIFSFFKTTASFVYMLQDTTIIYDVMAAFLMPRRVDYINYRLIDEVINLTELDNMDEFCRHHHMMITEVRKLAESVKHLDDHSRTRITLERSGAHSHINFDKLLATVFNAACDPRLDRNVAMTMMCSMAVSYRSNKSLYAFLDTIPTHRQYSKRVQDLYTRLTIGLRPCDRQAVGRNLLKDIKADKYDRELGLCDPPPKYKRPHFSTRYMHGTYVTPTFDLYTALTRDNPRPLFPEQKGIPQPLEALYLFVSSFDRNFSGLEEYYYDSWDLLTTDMLECTKLLPLTADGHYLDQAFFYIYKSARS